MEDALVEGLAGAHVDEGFLGSVLLALFLGEARAAAGLDALEEGDADKLGTVAAGLVDLRVAVGHLDAVLLRPLQEFALEVDFLARHGVHIEQRTDDAVADEPLAVAVAAVQIDGADEGLEGVAADVDIVGAGHERLVDEFIQSHLVGKAVEHGALHEFGAGAGQEALALTGVFVVEDVAGDGFEDGIAEILQPLVVERALEALSAAGAKLGRLMGQGDAIDVQVAGIKAQDIAQGRGKGLVLAEHEPHPVYELVDHSVALCFPCFPRCRCPFPAEPSAGKERRLRG